MTSRHHLPTLLVLTALSLGVAGCDSDSDSDNNDGTASQGQGGADAGAGGTQGGQSSAGKGGAAGQGGAGASGASGASGKGGTLGGSSGQSGAGQAGSAPGPGGAAGASGGAGAAGNAGAAGTAGAAGASTAGTAGESGSAGSGGAPGPGGSGGAEAGGSGQGGVGGAGAGGNNAGSAGAPTGGSGGTAGGSGGQAGMVSTYTPKGLCNADGWCWEHPLPQGNALLGVSAIGPGELFFAGSSGDLLKRTGGVISRRELTTVFQVSSVWAASAEKVFVAQANLSQVLVVNETTGTVDKANVTCIGLGGFHAIDGLSAQDVYVSGRSGCVGHFDGKEWSGLSVPAGGDLDYVAAVAPGLAYTAALSGLYRISGNDSQLVEGAPQGLIGGLHAQSGTLYVAVNTEVYRYDGTTWTLDKDVGFVVKALGGGPAGGGSVIAVGDGGKIARRDSAGAWADESFATPIALRSATVDPAGTAYVVGDQGFLAERGPSGWTELSNRVTTEGLVAVAPRPASGPVLIGGKSIFGLDLGTMSVLHDDAGTTLSALAVEADGTILVAGKGPQVVLYKGSSVSLSPVPDIGQVNIQALLSVSPTERYALATGSAVFIGRAGMVFRFDSAGWTSDWQGLPSDIYPTPFAIAVDPSGVPVVAGLSTKGAFTIRRSSPQWETLSNPATTLFSLAATSTTIYASGSGLFSLNGSAFTNAAPEDPAFPTNWQTLVATPKDELFGVAFNGNVRRLSGGTWTAQQLGTRNTFSASTVAMGRIYLVGEGGTVLSRALD